MIKNTETTRRALYECLDRIRRAGKHRKLTLEFEGLLEEHLEATGPRLVMALIQERNDLQARLHAVDTAYAKSQEALGVAGSEIRSLQADLKNWRDDAKFSDDRVDELSKANRDLDAVVRNQRQAYAELFMVKNGTSDRCHILDMSKAKLLMAKAALLEHKLMEFKK